MLDDGPALVGLSTACNEPQLRTLAPANCIIRCSIVVEVKVFLDPLQHLKVVLILRTHELSGVDKASDIVLLEARLQDLVVVGILVVMLGSPVHLAHLHCAWVDGIKDLTVDRTCGALLHLLDAELVRGQGRQSIPGRRC